MDSRKHAFSRGALLGALALWLAAAPVAAQPTRPDAVQPARPGAAPQAGQSQDAPRARQPQDVPRAGQPQDTPRAAPSPDAPQPAMASGKQDYSQAERLLFMTNQLAGIKPPATLRYNFRKSGTLEDGFEDTVTIALAREPDGECCQAKGEFLSGQRRLELPDIEHAEANPVVLFFLEHDVRDMKRLTKGASNYYRKRIRMAVYEGAKVRDVSLDYRGRPVKGQRIEISPYQDDPARSRFEKFADKTYRFYLSKAVPGGIYGIRTVMLDQGASAAAPMIAEELFIEGARPPKE